MFHMTQTSQIHATWDANARVLLDTVNVGKKGSTAVRVTTALLCTNGYTTRGHHANALCPPQLLAGVLCQFCGLRGM